MSANQPQPANDRNRCRVVITDRMSSRQVPSGVKSFPAFRG